ncbi:MAG: hypothetical protein J5744_07635 [Oscillospiraceae bacterium]|nr:hypothetical protein [Oscillospiraceae bacterium]
MTAEEIKEMEDQAEAEGIKDPEFDLEKWQRQKRAERDAAFSMMNSMAEIVRDDPESLRKYLELMIRFPALSAGNLLLVLAQKPDAVDLREFRIWKELGTSIRKGENAVLLLEPGSEYKRKDGSTGVYFNVKKLFDITQTRALRNMPVEFPTDSVRLVKALSSCAPCEIVVDGTMDRMSNDLAEFDEEKQAIRIADTQDKAKLFPHLCRETAMAYMAAGDSAPDHMRDTAHCVAYAVSIRKGFRPENWRFAQVCQSVADMSPREMRRFLGRIRDLTGAIVDDIHQYFIDRTEERVSEAVR